MTGIGAGLAGLSVAQKLTRIGIAVAILAALVGLVFLYGASKYDAGHDKGVLETDAKWESAVAELRAQAQRSATQADDRAVARLEEFEQQAEDDRKAVENANQNGTSPLDALFGG